MMNNTHDDVTPDLVSDLLDKCEVKEIPQYYEKKVAEAGGILPVNLMYTYHPRFSREVVERDTLGLDSILLIKPDPGMTAHFPIKYQYKSQNEFLVNLRGFIKCLKSALPRQKPLKVPVSEILEKLGVEERSKNKVDAWLSEINASQTNLGFRRIVVGEDERGVGWVKCESVWNDPKKRTQLIQLLIVSIFGILVITFLVIVLQGLHFSIG
ncbi:MAG: hypothetical protein ACTSU5_05550 [Promethearchaeota archaeon]